jgi:predicted exporter
VVLIVAIPRTRFSANVTELLPATGLEVGILRELSETRQGHLAIAHLGAPAGGIQDAAVDAFVGSLATEDCIVRVSVAGADALKETAAVLYAQRHALLLPGWLADHPGLTDAESLAARIVDRLEAFLNEPDSLALTELIPSDPLLLMRGMIEGSEAMQWAASDSGVTIWIEQEPSPFSEEGQAPVFAAIERAHAAALAIQQPLELRYTSLSRFASASKAAIKGEITRINLLCLALVALLLVVVVRSWRPLAAVALTVVFAMVTAAAAVTVCFGEVHILSLVIGSILAGIAVDYGLHLVLEERHGMRRHAVTRVVLAGSVSSAAGFLTLLWAPLPFLQQVGVFVGTGLLAALVAALILRPKAGKAAATIGLRYEPFRLPRWTGPLLAIAFVPGLLLLQWGDRIRSLEFPLPELYEEDANVRAAAGANAYQPYLVHAADPLTARVLLEARRAALAQPGSLHLADWVPTYTRIRDTMAFFRSIESFELALRAELEARGYVADAFAPFFADFDAYLRADFSESAYQELLKTIADSLPGPLESLVHLGEEISWFMVLLPDGHEPLSGEGVFRLDQSKILDGAFARYRQSMARQIGFCLVILMLAVLFLIGTQRGAAAIALTLLAVACAFGLAGYLGLELGLFHMVGALLAFCIVLDYAIFAVETRHHDNRLPASVAVSALSTAGVFAVLGSSPIPAVQALGLTVLSIITIGLLLIFCGWPWVRRLPVLDRSLFDRLPHGEDALLIAGMRSLDGNTIAVYLDARRGQVLAGEALVEAMAQAAALLMAARSDRSERNRIGMLVLVQQATLPGQGFLPQHGDIVEVESVSPLQPGILRFRGKLLSRQSAFPATAEFSIFVPEANPMG